MKTSIIIDLAGNLEARARRYSRAIHRMSGQARRDLGLMAGAADRVGRGIDRLGNRYSLAGLGAGAVLAGRQVMDLQRRFTRLGIQANRSRAVMEMLKREIFEAAMAPDIRIDPQAITTAVAEIVEKTGDLDFARENIRNIGLALQATGADGQAIGGIFAEMEKMGLKGSITVLRVLDTLNEQGKMGAFTLQNLAALGPRVFSAYNSVVKGARSGEQVVREMGAALQVIRMGTGSSEQAATAFERLLAELTNVDKLKMLRAGGIQVFDPKAAARGIEAIRPINELLLEIMEKTKGRRTILGQIFGDEAIRAFNALNAERMRRFMAVQADGSATVRDSARAARDAAAAMTNLHTAWQRFADAKLAGPIQALADALNRLGASNAIEATASLAGAAGAAWLGRKAYKGGKAGTGALVRYGTGAARRTAGGALARLGARALGMANPVLAVGSVGLTAVEIGSAFEKAFIGGRIGEWLYDVTHSKVDVNIRLDQDGRPRVRSVRTQGLAGEASVDHGPMMVGNG
ncbi:MAG: hypothetical protein D6717_00355 [Gammaproteobacteria bacterium]|nr:MAG: hypothetical protein D6717_00355 [Gammaproteobacteria bacterium]